VGSSLTGLRFSCAATMAVAFSAHKSSPRQLLAPVRLTLLRGSTSLERRSGAVQHRQD